MSRATQIEFERLVSSCYQIIGHGVKLAAPTFEENGFVTRARLKGVGGHVELLCGPAEYHAEVFVCTDKDGKRWALSDLMTLKNVRNWMFLNRSGPTGRSTLEADVEYAFRLLSEVLSNESEFSWIGSVR